MTQTTKKRVDQDLPLPPDWEGILHAIPDGLIVTDRQMNILFVNRNFLTLAGKGNRPLVGKKCYDLFASPLCHTPACPMARIQAGEKKLAYNTDAHCKNGQQVPRLITATALEDSDGRLVGMVERITDENALEQAQSELYRSHERLRKNMGAIIQAMSMTMEKRDPYTAGHQRRVAKLCRAIATELGFKWSRIQGLRMAAAIHDLGKIHVPAGILNKPGRISGPELAIIRMHPRTAYDILKGIQFPWPLAETIYQHHERLNGSGYPRKLKGDQILLEARILAVADVVESMSSFRPYRPALGQTAALDEIQQGKGVLYDETVVDVCLELIARKGFDFKTKRWQRRKKGGKVPKPQNPDTLADLT